MPHHAPYFCGLGCSLPLRGMGAAPGHVVQHRRACRGVRAVLLRRRAPAASGRGGGTSCRRSAPPHRGTPRGARHHLPFTASMVKKGSRRRSRPRSSPASSAPGRPSVPARPTRHGRHRGDRPAVTASAYRLDLPAASLRCRRLRPTARSHVQLHGFLPADRAMYPSSRTK